MSKISKLGRVLVAAGTVVLAGGLDALTIDVQKAPKAEILNTEEIVTNVTFDLDLPYGSIGNAGLVQPLSVNSTNQSGIVFANNGTIYVNADSDYGLYRTASGKLAVSAATWQDYLDGVSWYKPITPAIMEDILDPFANRVEGAVEGNFASLDEDGDLVDSGYNPGSFAPSNTVVYKVVGATNDNLAVFAADGSIKDTGVKVSQFATAEQGTTADNAIPKVPSAVNDNFAAFNDGAVKDSGVNASTFATAEQGARADRAAQNIAPEFELPPSGGFAIYAKDDLRTYKGILYRCKSDHMAYSNDPTPDKDGTHWESNTVDKLFLRVNNGVAQASSLVTSSIKIDAPSAFGDIPVTIGGGKVILYPGDLERGSTLTIPYQAGKKDSFALLSDIYAAVTNIAPAWVSGATYSSNSIVSYNGAVYARKTSDSISSAYNPASDTTNWEMKKVSDLFLPLNGGTVTGDLYVDDLKCKMRHVDSGVVHGARFTVASKTNEHYAQFAYQDDEYGIFVKDGSKDAGTFYAFSAIDNKSEIGHTHYWNEINGRPTKVSDFTNDAKYVDKSVTNDLAKQVAKLESRTNDWNTVNWSEVVGKPTNVSAFSNDAGYLTSESDPSVHDWAKAETKPSYTANEVGVSLLDMLSPDLEVSYYGKKLVVGDKNVLFYNWVFEPSKPTYSWSEIENTPTTVSSFENDANYLTSESDPSVYAWAKAATKPSYTWTEIGNRPTNVSDFTNDVNYIKLTEFKAAVLAAVTNEIPVITDNGDGFTEEDLVKSINEIAGALNRLRDAALVP